MPVLSPLRLFTLAAVSLLAGGCSIHGNYQDPVQADAAKLRFITKVDSTSLSLFDTEHCQGRTAGLLNNLLTADTVRRADMKAPAPDNAGPYIEVRLAPGKEQLLQTNTITTGYAVCTTYINLTPQPGSEYELTLVREGNRCVTSLTTLHHLNGKTARRVLPIRGETLPACAGTSPLFPRFDPQPDTPERTALIDKIISDSITPAMRAPDPIRDPAAVATRVVAEVDQRKALLEFSMPDSYWAEYRENWATFIDALETRKPQLLGHYQDDSRKRLRSLQTDELTALAKFSRPDQPNAKLFRPYLPSYDYMMGDILKDEYGKLNTRLAELDKRYDVCSRSVDCWKN